MRRKALIVGVLVLTLLVMGSVLLTLLHQETPTEETVSTSEAAELRALKNEWVSLIQQLGPEAAYAAFVEGAEERTLKPHDQAHAFGEALYDTYGLEGFQYCDASFEYGCYHSYFGAAIAGEGVDVLPFFDTACKEMYGEEDTSCQHGIGHGVMFYAGYDNLVGALELCEVIAKGPISGCTNGLFMEYNFHTMEGGDGYTREESDNPYEPCDTLPERFQVACFYDQVQWWDSIYLNDHQKMSALCDGLLGTRSLYEACYNGIGKYIAAFYGDDVKSMVQKCLSMHTDETKTLCSEGAAHMFATNPQRRSDVETLCGALPEPFNRACTEKLLP